MPKHKKMSIAKARSSIQTIWDATSKPVPTPKPPESVSTPRPPSQVRRDHASKEIEKALVQANQKLNEANQKLNEAVQKLQRDLRKESDQKKQWMTFAQAMDQTNKDPETRVFLESLCNAKCSTEFRMQLANCISGISHKNDGVDSKGFSPAYGEILPSAIMEGVFAKLWQGASEIVDLGMGRGFLLVQMMLWFLQAQQSMTFFAYELAKSRFQDSIKVIEQFNRIAQISEPEETKNMLLVQDNKNVSYKHEMKGGKSQLKLFLRQNCGTKHIHVYPPKPRVFYIFDIRLENKSDPQWINFWKGASVACHVLSFWCLPDIFPEPDWTCLQLPLATSWENDDGENEWTFYLYNKL